MPVGRETFGIRSSWLICLEQLYIREQQPAHAVLACEVLKRQLHLQNGSEFTTAIFRRYVGKPRMCEGEDGT